MKRHVAIVLGIALAATTAPAQIFPLAEGFLWEYRASFGDEWTIVNGGETTFNGATCVVQHHETVGIYPSVFRQYWSIDGEGDVFYHGVEGDGYELAQDPPVLYMDVPLEPGKTWTTVSFNGIQFRTHTFVVEEMEQVVVPAGTFQAWRVAYYIDDQRLDRWMVDGVGEVIRGVFELVAYGEPTGVEPRSLSAVKDLFR